VRPGAGFHDYHKTAERVLAQGYLESAVPRTLDEVLETGAYSILHAPRRPLARHGRPRRGPLSIEGASQKLVPGMVLTVEPGTYIRRPTMSRRVLGHRVRIEDESSSRPQESRT
jgi:Xaa-Pro aminopeptidase